MLKRLFSIITISLVLTGSFFSAYNIKYPVYADSTTDGWTQVTTNEQLVEAFKYYCKSRDLTIEGSLADGVTSFTTNTFNGICNTLGIDITALQAEIKYQTDANLGLRFLFSSVGINAFNRIFAQFLQDNNLSVGDTVNNQSVFSGKLFTDLDGNKALVWKIDTYTDEVTGHILATGSYYKYTNPECLSLYNSNSNAVFRLVEGKTFTYNFVNYTDGTPNVNIIKFNYNGSFNFMFGISGKSYNDTVYGYPILYERTDFPNRIYCGVYTQCNGDFMGSFGYFIPSSYDMTVPTVNVYITTNNKTINNNTYEGDTIINNNGDTNNYYPDNPDDPDDPDLPPSNPTIPDNGGWQDFTLPDMPNDWLIYGMEKKFPFDIPFNILFALSLLNHEPEIPKFEGDIDLQVCTWHYDIDLTPFDDIATILRKFEVLGFIIGLAILTKNLINWG